MPGKKKLTANPAPKTLDEAFQDFVAEKQALNRSTATITNLENSIEKFESFIESQGLSNSVKDLRVEIIQQFSRFNLDEGMKGTTLNHYLRDIRTFCYWCMRQRLCSSCKISLVSEQQTIVETYTDEEALRLIEKPRDTERFTVWRSWAVINFALATGARAGTICNLRVGDIDIKHKEISIRKTKTRIAQVLPLSDALIKALKDYMRKWRFDCDNDAFLFPNEQDKQLTTNALKLSIGKYNNSRGVEKTSIHAFRHTFAKDYIRNDGNVLKLQRILGHSTLEMTKHYVSLFSEDLKKDYEDFSPLDKLKSGTNRKSAFRKSR